MKHHISEVEAALRKLPQRTSAHNSEAYIGGGQSKLRYIGLKVPDVRGVYKAGFSFSRNDPKEVAEIWDFVWWNSDCYEVMSMALAWFEDPKRRAELPKHWPRLMRWADRIDNWAHSDSLSGIYARIHEDSPALAYPTFKKWNASPNPWLRRQSIVSLFYYSAQREKHPPLAKVLALLKPQLKFDHYYVQKGVGWTLREAGNVYPAPVYKFIEQNIGIISPHAYSAATEKMSLAQRARLKRLRKQARFER